MSKTESPSTSALRVNEADFTAGATNAAQLPAKMVLEAAFMGRSNVGKSSLLNMLVQRNKLVRTSKHPGCTRQINVFTVKVASGITTSLVDLPGYGYAAVSKSERQAWRPMVEGYISSKRADHLYLLVDVRRGLQREEEQLIEFLDMEGYGPDRTTILATKADKAASGEGKKLVDRLRVVTKRTVILTSADTRLGREEVLHRLIPRAPRAPQAAPSAAEVDPSHVEATE